MRRAYNSNHQIKFDDIFNILCCLDKRGKPIWRLQFKTGGLMPNGMTVRRDNVELIGYRWIKQNQREAADMVFELEILEAPTGIDPVSPR